MEFGRRPCGGKKRRFRGRKTKGGGVHKKERERGGVPPSFTREGRVFFPHPVVVMSGKKTPSWGARIIYEDET